jgi:spermidine/putrescine transport system substrate-binding protein
MAEEGLLEPLNLDNIPNFAHIDDQFKNPPYDPDNTYSVPYQWGTVGIGYNITEVGEEITSWQQMFEYDGPVAWLEDLRAMLGISLVMLGYDPNTDNPDEIAEARDYLIANSGNVVAIAQDDGQAMLARGDVHITVEYNGDIFQIMDECECEDYAYAIPREGTLVWVDNLAIPAGAPNHALAEVFIDYILHPQVGADISNYTAYATPNRTAIEMGLIDEAYLSDTAIYPDEETFERLFFIRDNPETEQLYNDAWDEVKVLIGQ